jgi:hypothetical protein
MVRALISSLPRRKRMAMSRFHNGVVATIGEMTTTRAEPKAMSESKAPSPSNNPDKEKWTMALGCHIGLRLFRDNQMYGTAPASETTATTAAKNTGSSVIVSP